jgi:galactokinase
VNLIGEHTDYNDGHVLPFAIAARTRVAVGLRGDGLVRVASLQRDGVVETDLTELPAATGWSAYVLGTVWAVREAGAEISGLDIVVDGSVPIGSGLSSSAAVECAVALAVADLTAGGRLASRLELARAGQRAEHEVVGVPVGIMDQAVSMLAEAGSALLVDCRALTWDQVPLDPDPAGLRLVLSDTRVKHDLADGQYAQRRRSCDQAAHSLAVPALRDLGAAQLPEAERLLDPVTFRRVRHVVTEEQRVLQAVAALRADDWPALGVLLSASHASLRDDYEVSVPELDGAVEAARSAGALGARMTGGGFGGTTVALVPAAAVPRVRAAVRRQAERAGWPRPTTVVVRPEAGARRER